MTKKSRTSWILLSHRAGWSASESAIMPKFFLSDEDPGRMSSLSAHA